MCDVIWQVQNQQIPIPGIGHISKLPTSQPISLRSILIL